MNRIYKVIYSKVKQCAVVVSELAKSHCKTTTTEHRVKGTALTAAVLMALTSVGFMAAPLTAQADTLSNNLIGINHYYFTGKKDDNGNPEVKEADLLWLQNNAANYNGQGANAQTTMGAITIGMNAVSGKDTITIGDRNAIQATQSVLIGSNYDAQHQTKPQTGSNVVAVGYESDATGNGSIAIGSGASADPWKNVSDKDKTNANKNNNSIAVGYNAQAQNNNIAIGANSVATAAASTLGTAKFREASAGDSKAPSSYISVGSDTVKRRITNVAAGSDDNDVATVGQLSYVEQEAKAKGSWKLTAGGINESTVEAGATVDFSAGSDGNLSVSKDKTSNKVTIGLNKDVILGKAAQGEGGSLSVYQDPASTDKENGNDQMGSHVRIDGSTVSIRYQNGTKDSDARGVVLGVAKDSSNPLGYMYLADGNNHYYVHGTMANDPKALQGRLVYNSSLTGYNYIANLEDGISFSGDAVKAGSTTTNTNTTADTRLDPTAANHTLSIKGGVTDTTQLTSNNIGVVTTPTEYDGTLSNGVTKAGGLTIQLAKDLKGITSIANGADGSGAKITLGTSGTTISGGDVNVSTHKITGLKDGAADTDAATVGQMKTAIGDAKTKYYSVQEGLQIGGFSTNENNDGATDVALAGMAAGYETGTTGIVSTVVGSYSGVIGSRLQGAAAVSVGTVNVNSNTDTNKAFSGVANSIVGQANMTTDSNAAIIVGAGNNVTNSYRDLDPEDALSKIMSAVASKDANALKEALQDAVPKSGGQVMVMGGGNNVESAYMSQVVGVGNTVKGNQVESKGEWVTDTPNTAIKYDPEKSSQYNYVDGFNNEVINGKHDYVIGANNKLSGDSYDDDQANPIKRSNKSNIVIGDNHTLTREKNTVIIGSSDTENTQTKANDAVIIGHNANATSNTGADNAVAIGRAATATGGNAVTIGVNTSAGDNSITIGSESHADSGSNIAIGRSAQVYGYEITNAVALGHNANAKVADGVAIGSGSEATVTGKSTEGYDPTTGKNSTETTSTWQATNAAVSIGTVDGKVTRQINGVAAGTNETDAVNVAQLKNATAGMTTKGLNFQGNNTDVTVHRDLGSTLTIKGNGTKDDSSYSADNIKVVGDANGSLTIMMDKEIKGDRITVGEKGEPGKEGQAGKDGVDGQIGVNGKDGSAVVINGKDGSIGLNGKDGANGLTIKGAKGDAGVDGTDGHDGKDGMTRIVYEDHNKVTHKVATLDDGMKYAGDFGDGVAVKLDKTVNIKGNVKEGAKSDDFVDGNIAVVANKKGDNGELQIKLNKNLTGLNSATYTTTTGEGESAKTSTTTVDGNGLTIMNGPSITNNGVDAGKKAITNVGNGIEKDSAGKYTVTDQNKGNAANIGDVQNMVNEAVNSAADTTNRALAGKANVDASNIGANLKGEDAEKTTNENAWGSAIGTGKIEANNGQLVTGKTVYEYNKPVAADGKTLKYVSEGETTGQNLGALDAQVKTNADDITNINNSISSLNQNAVKYDDSDKSKISLGGEGGTTITNVKDGALNDSSTDAVNGKQLYAEQTARKELETKVTSNTTEINNIKDGQGFTGKGKEVIRDLAKGSVKVIAGTNTTVTPGTDEDGATTYAVNVEGNGKVASGDTNLISGGTLYNEVHVDKDGTYIKSKDSATGKDMTVAQNLSALDSGLKTTSDLIHTNTAGDTIQIGGSSTATKIDVNGKDGKGRVITGVVSDANDPTSAANVGYVNGVTAANTQQIYRDMNNAYGRLNNNINKAAAGSNALAALHPLDYDPDDKADFAVGYGHYRNANAAAVGAFYHPNENTMVNVGVSLGNGDPGFNAGVSFKVGRGGAGREAMSKTEMAKVINSQSKEIDALKKDNADKDKRIDALEQKMAEILAKLDKNGK